MAASEARGVQAPTVGSGAPVAAQHLLVELVEQVSVGMREPSLSPMTGRSRQQGLTPSACSLNLSPDPVWVVMERLELPPRAEQVARVVRALAVVMRGLAAAPLLMVAPGEQALAGMVLAYRL